MTSRIRKFLLLGSLVSLFCETGSAAPTLTWPQAPQASKGSPDIVLILLDDVGFAASSTFGGPAATPALDQLAAQGLRYNQFHTTAICSPTRASLLTGRNHHRVSFGSVTEFGNANDGYNAFWPKSVVSLPEILRRNGYSTAAFGKWHNTPFEETSPAGPFDRWPTGLGFEYFYGFMLSEASQWEPPLYRNTTPVEPSKTPQQGYHFTTDITDDAINWIHTHQSVVPDKPYFLYFAPGATHAPAHVPQEWIDKYKGKFDQGWDKLREEIIVRQKALGVIPANADLTLRPKVFPAWDSLSADQKRLYAHQAEVYAAFLSHTDYEIGRLLDAIHQGPNGDNTLVLYIVGDNGATTDGSFNGTDHLTADSITGIYPGTKEQLANIDKLGGPEFDDYQAAAWSWALDTPFQWTKMIASHFGGTRNPMVVSWPARIKDAGTVRSQFSHVNDIAPTIYDLLGIKFPKEVDGVKQEPLDGVSLAQSFTSDGPSSHHVQYFEQLGNRAIYKDGWIACAFHDVPLALKQTRKFNSDFAHDRWELYNIQEDFSEAHDLARKYPAKLAALKKLFNAEARRNKVYPLSNGMSEGFLTAASGGRPTLTGTRKEFTYFDTMPRMPSSAAPILLGSHHITAELDVPATGAAGVIVANGGRYGGYTLYVKDGRLVYEHNFFGHERSVITSTMTLPTGHVEVGFDFERQDQQKWGGGIGRLTINGQPAGEGNIAHVGLAAMVDTFDIGADRTSPVSDAYTVPATFTGRVDKVRIRLE